jgi:hypothetical protein
MDQLKVDEEDREVAAAAAAAQLCLNKEEEVVSLWKTRVLTYPEDMTSYPSTPWLTVA